MIAKDKCASSPPVLSIIIPYRNKRKELPRMLESIHTQSLRELEVVIVNDKSDEPCTDIVDAYINKGLSINLVISESHIYTKNSRLLGIKNAQADIIAFADADDILWGTNNLEQNVLLYIRNNADLLQFRCVYIGKH